MFTLLFCIFFSPLEQVVSPSSCPGVLCLFQHPTQCQQMLHAQDLWLHTMAMGENVCTKQAKTMKTNTPLLPPVTVNASPQCSWEYFREPSTQNTGNGSHPYLPSSFKHRSHLQVTGKTKIFIQLHESLIYLGKKEHSPLAQQAEMSALNMVCKI